MKEKPKELEDHEAQKILKFWEESNQEDPWCNAFLGICAATQANDYDDRSDKLFLSSEDYDLMFQLKYKYGKKIIGMIEKLEHGQQKSKTDTFR